jgi:hypothetical protein
VLVNALIHGLAVEAVDGCVLDRPAGPDARCITGTSTQFDLPSYRKPIMIGL